MDKPLFSIIIPTYNRGHLLHRTIASVLDQSFTQYEIIVVDDGSTDDTAEVVANIHSDRISYYHKTNAERGAARNYGVDKAYGEYITFLDSDDILYPHHLDRARTHTELGHSFFWLPYEIIDSAAKVVQEHKPIESAPFDHLVSQGNFMSCHGVFMTRGLALAHKFSELRPLSGSEDLELWIRLTSRYTLVMDDKVSNALIEHEERSVLNFDDAQALLKRKELMIELLEKDAVVNDRLSGDYSAMRFAAHSYVALHAAMNPHISVRFAIGQYLGAVRYSPSKLLSRRSLAVVKRLLIRIFA